MTKAKKIKTGKDIIDSGQPANCDICYNIFYRIRQTFRYCKLCKAAFCEGEHGTFANNKFAYCVRCATLK